jgi:hypothetical protein
MAIPARRKSRTPVLDYVFAAQAVSADRRQEDRTCSMKERERYYQISVIGIDHIKVLAVLAGETSHAHLLHICHSRADRFQRWIFQTSSIRRRTAHSVPQPRRVLSGSGRLSADRHPVCQEPPAFYVAWRALANLANLCGIIAMVVKRKNGWRHWQAQIR